MGSTESRVAFHERLNRLLTQPVALDEDEFWDSFFNLPLSVSEIFEVISPDDVRKLRTERKLNTSNLLKRILRILRGVIWEGSYEAKDGQQLSKASSTAALTAVRLLTRLMPFLLEEPQDEFIRILFWRPGGYIPHVQSEFQQQEKPDIIEADATDEKDVKERDTFIMGQEILICLQRLLFLKGFGCHAQGVTLIAEEPLPMHKVDTRFIWKGGIGTSVELPTVVQAQLMRNRTEVLRCILVCLSGSLYQTIDEYQKTIPIWLRKFTRGDLPYTANLFCSLMSTVFTFDPVGYGVPYAGSWSGKDGEELTNVSIQLLCVLMDFNPTVFFGSSPSMQTSSRLGSKVETSGEGVRPSSPSAGGSQVAEFVHSSASEDFDGPSRYMRSGSSEVGMSPCRNVYRTMLAGVRKDAEIDLIFEGAVRLLTSVPKARSSYLPNSQSAISFHQELLILLWHLLTSNTSFLKRLTSRLNSNSLLSPLLYLLLDSSNARRAVENGQADKSSDTASGPSRVGLLHMTSFLLLVLSSEREFAVRLNEAFTEKFALDIPIFQGSHADLLVLVIHRVVADCAGNVANDSLVDMLLTVMCNISAYIKAFCLESCVKVVSLIHRFSRPSWLFSAPYHYHDVFFLLDMFNNVIQYQYEGNQRLVYSILRQKEIFLDLQNLQFPSKYLKSDEAEPPTTSSDQNISTPVHTTTSVTPSSAASTAPMSQNSTNGVAAAPEAQRGVPATSPAPPKVQTAPATSSVLPHAAAVDADGGSPWSPTPEWFADWRNKLPLQTILRLIQCLLPMVESECQEKGLIDQAEVLEFLQRTTLVGLLPVPHPIIIRNYQPNAYTALWFTSYLWGVIFSRSQSLYLYDWRKIRFIVINNRKGTASGHEEGQDGQKAIENDSQPETSPPSTTA